MRYLADGSNLQSKPITLVPMRGKWDCLTCVSAMLLGLRYEDVEQAFGGNIDPSKGQEEESSRVQGAFLSLIERHNVGALQVSTDPPTALGRRYWVTVKVDDPATPLSQSMTHSIAIDEAGRVFDPNPDCGEFGSLNDWSAAMTLRHELASVVEIFEYVP
jgi:hypothetical protein